jgi:Na+-transporting methylmalonyl-CoA/oxaloacetate decarboxylase gamma subunit
VVVTVAGLGWLLIVLLVLAVVRWALDRRRMAAWATEWEKAERAWRWLTP